MDALDPARLVFVDECGTHTSMTRRRARAVRGERARGSVPRNRGPVTTLIAGVSLAGMSPAMTVEGGTDTAVFATYLEHFLLPALAPGTVVGGAGGSGAAPASPLGRGPSRARLGEEPRRMHLASSPGLCPERLN